jgi:hypothetical protein
MRSKITVVGEQPHPVVDELSAGDRLNVAAVAADAWHDLAGSDVVVVLDGADVPEAARAALRRASCAMLLVATADPERDVTRALEAGLAPRPRVVGIAREHVLAATEAFAFGRRATLPVAVMCQGELGIENRVATVTATLGVTGIERIGEEDPR